MVWCRGPNKEGEREGGSERKRDTEKEGEKGMESKRKRGSGYGVGIFCNVNAK